MRTRGRGKSNISSLRGKDRRSTSDIDHHRKTRGEKKERIIYKSREGKKGEKEGERPG